MLESIASNQVEPEMATPLMEHLSSQIALPKRSRFARIYVEPRVAQEERREPRIDSTGSPCSAGTDRAPSQQQRISEIEATSIRSRWATRGAWEQCS